ncbi:MAG: GNAT family N-acetyltransferase [Methanobacterium sp.]|nr:GNAT family N-acetyltransferase [Methanobacterium sp.]
MDHYHLRNVEEEDFLNISRIANNCEPMITERNSIYHLFTKFFNNTSLIIEKDDKSIMGFLLGFQSQKNPKDAYIHLICVVPQLRNQGLAKALVKEFLNIVSKKGCNNVYLITSPTNKKAINFYRNMGFEVDKKGKEIIIDGISTFKDYNGPGEHKVIFNKLLSN